jgi:hypothetical protein
MIATIGLIVGVALTTYEGIVRIFPQIDVKFSIIHKILTWLQVLSGTLNNKGN